MSIEEAKDILAITDHDIDILAFMTDCECEYCVSEREYQVNKAKRIRGQLKEAGWTPPKVFS